MLDPILFFVSNCFLFVVGKNSRSLALCWKLILSCPETQEDEEFFPFLQMLRRKFQKSLGGGTVRGEGGGLLVCRTVPGTTRPGTTVSACVRQVRKNYEYVSPLTVEYFTFGLKAGLTGEPG